jgi:hypothetical protein
MQAPRDGVAVKSGLHEGVVRQKWYALHLFAWFGTSRRWWSGGLLSLSDEVWEEAPESETRAPVDEGQAFSPGQPGPRTSPLKIRTALSD